MMCRDDELNTANAAPMRIGVIQASSQAGKNTLLYETVKKYASDADVINFGCFPDEEEKYTYIEISILIGILLGSGAVDLVVTGCSSGQGMMLACNNMPGVLCGYIPTPQDAYLFAQINDGNCVSVPLGEEYTWQGKENLVRTIEKLFSEPFGQGYPKSEAERKLKDTKLLKDIRKNSQVSLSILLDMLDPDMIGKILKKKDVIDYVLENGKDKVLSARIKEHAYNMSYLFTLRSSLGHAPLIAAGAGVVVVNERNEILLGRRSDNGYWDYPGGGMELGESFEECARREVLEETGILCGKMEILSELSGKDTFYMFPNGDQIYIAGLVFICFDYSGELKVQEEEVVEQRFFPIDDLPENTHPLKTEILAKVREYLNTRPRMV